MSAIFNRDRPFNQCVVPGCDHHVFKGRVCSMHIQRKWRTGSVDLLPPTNKRGQGVRALTEADGERIRNMAPSKSTRDIARKFEVSDQTIRRVLKGTYKFADLSGRDVRACVPHPSPDNAAKEKP